jgi:DNA polymerase III subunit chi
VPDITFYVLASESATERQLFACKLIEKAYRSGAVVYVLMDNDSQSQALDDLLWTFRAGSFIPHQVYDGVAQPPALANTVLLGWLEPPVGWQQTLVNLSSQCPKAFAQFSRIIEILDNSATTKEWGRQRYRQYRQAGIEPVTHKTG